VVPELESQGRMVEAQRIHQRTRYDLEMIKFDGLLPRDRELFAALLGASTGRGAATLLDYFPAIFCSLWMRATRRFRRCMGCGTATAAATNLVDYGFRLPSAMDNRPLKFEEFENRVQQAIYVSATPGPYELTRSAGIVVEAGDPPHRPR